MSLKRDMTMVSQDSSLFSFFIPHLSLLFSFNQFSITPTQVTQQIFVAEEWAKKDREDLHTEVQSCIAAEKATGALRLEKDRLNKEVKDVLKAHDSAEAGLKTTTQQAEDMHKQLHMSEINLATESQMVSDLKAELSKAKEAAHLAREATEAAVAASYERRVADTEARLIEEVATVCRDYITMSWGWPWTGRQFLRTPTSRRLRISSFLKIF